MEPTQLIWLGAIVGGAVGSALPMLWGGSELSFASVILTAVGGFLGIYIAFKLSR